jgi:hypothetical protein
MSDTSSWNANLSGPPPEPSGIQPIVYTIGSIIIGSIVICIISICCIRKKMKNRNKIAITNELPEVKKKTPRNKRSSSTDEVRETDQKGDNESTI